MKNLYPTPHINATPSDFAKTVLMPGDPLRAKYIAENFLENARLVNNVRGVQGFTGLYKGTAVSVMASGMGMPSIGIYSYELYNFFDVQNIIRVGSAGGIQKNVKIRDVVLGSSACTNSNYADQFSLPGNFAPVADFSLLSLARDISDEMKIKYHIGNVLSSDTFYCDCEEKGASAWAKMGVLAVEMEAAALYMNAARAGKRALAVLTVSDSIVTGEATTSDERERSFDDMVKLALEVALRAEKL